VIEISKKLHKRDAYKAPDNQTSQQFHGGFRNDHFSNSRGIPAT
jgi:hypothetical protein